MARAREPRPRALSVVFGAYFLIVIVLAFYLAPPVAPYVDPGATFWISATYMLLGALALAGIGTGALARARRLDARLEVLEAVRSRVRRPPRPTRRVRTEVPPSWDAAPIDSGSADREVESLLEGLQGMTDAASTDAGAVPDAGENPEETPTPADDLLRDAAWEIERVRTARDAIVITLLGPTLAAIALVGVFAPLLPASDGMLLADLQFNAFVGIAGLGSVVGLGVYVAAAFRQIGRRVR